MWLSPGQRAANCCVFKTHSVAGPLPRKVHFPFPIQPHGLSSATVFSLRQRQPPAAVWAPTPSPSAHFDPSVHIIHQIHHRTVSRERSRGMTFKPYAERETSCPLVRCPVIAYHYVLCVERVSWFTLAFSCYWSAGFWTLLSHDSSAAGCVKSCCHVGAIVFCMNTKPLFTNL